MKPENIERSVGLLIHDVSRLMRRRMELRLKSDGLTRGQWTVLFHLFRFEGINQTSLADILDIEPISLVRILDRLEASGWIERRVDPNDRRARLLYLRPEACKAIEPVWTVGIEVRKEALAGVSSEEQDRFIEILQLMKENLSGKEEAGDQNKVKREQKNG